MPGCRSISGGRRNRRGDHHPVDDDAVGFAEGHDLLGLEVTGPVGGQETGRVEHVQDIRQMPRIPVVIQALQGCNGKIGRRPASSGCCRSAPWPGRGTTTDGDDVPVQPVTPASPKPSPCPFRMLPPPIVTPARRQTLPSFCRRCFATGRRGRPWGTFSFFWRSFMP